MSNREESILLQEVPETRALLRELVTRLRDNQAEYFEEWIFQITDAGLLKGLSSEEILYETMTVYDHYVAVLETGSVEGLQGYARDLSERIIPRGMEINEVLGFVLFLCNLLGHSILKKYQADS
ncbi:MAG: hypothetical protein HY200_00410 [Nitrospirae bacterium]|nr:hypothetical protein [Nitrospirota bacterium]MBI3593399.1 hypothetical protein [Nitrospirota bacterium]